MTFLIRLQGRSVEPAVGETYGHRERHHFEVVHHRETDDDPRCSHCHVTTGPFEPWLSSKERYSIHPTRCEVAAFQPERK